MAPHGTRASIARCVVLFFAVLVVVDSSRNHGNLQLQLGEGFPAAQHDSSLLRPAFAPSSDGPHVIIYEDGIVVETILNENHLGISIYSTLAVPDKDFLYAIDSTASQLLKIRLPVDQSSGDAIARRVAGDGKGRTGYNDGRGEDALLDHPKSMAVDDEGNVYVADVKNRVIRKISPAGFVSTLAGQPNKTGHADGKGSNALFSSDFTLTYVPRTCSLLISDRGNGRLRMIQLKKSPQKCNYEEIPSGRVWKTVSYILGIFGVLMTILSAAFGIRLFQMGEFRSFGFPLALEDECASPLNGYHNGGPSDFPFLTARPRLGDSVATLRRGRSLPEDISIVNFFKRPNLIDFSDSPSYAREQSPPRNRLENSAFDRSRDAESDDLLSIFSVGEGHRTRTPNGVRIRSLEQDLLSDPEIMLTGSNDSLSRPQHNNSALLAPDRRISIDEEISRALDRFSHSNGN